MELKRIVFTFTALLLLCQAAWAETKQSEFALFKRTISPVYKWGANGAITVPKAVPVGKGTIYLGSSIQDSGKIEGDRLFLTDVTLMAGTSDDVEFGWTKRQFIWDDFDKTDLSMDTFNFKARIFHMTDAYIPQIAIGLNAVSLSENEFSEEEDILFNPFITTTIQAPFMDNKVVVSATGVIEAIHNEGKSSELFFSAAADVTLFDMLCLITEVHGLNKAEEDYIFNIGARATYGWFSIGIASYNLVEGDVKAEEGSSENDSTDIKAYALVEVPFMSFFKKEEKKE